MRRGWVREARHVQLTADGLGKALEHVTIFAPAGDMVFEQANDRVVEQDGRFWVLTRVIRGNNEIMTLPKLKILMSHIPGFNCSSRV
jgi:hypothetical protein